MTDINEMISLTLILRIDEIICLGSALTIFPYLFRKKFTTKRLKNFPIANHNVASIIRTGHKIRPNVLDKYEKQITLFH